MASLLEIADVARTIEVKGKHIEVFGISGRGIAALMVRFPAIGKLLAGGSTPNAEDIGAIAPDALAAFLAAGCGFPGDKEAELVADKLSVSEQLDLFDEIMRLTFPRGIGPFVEKLQALGLLAQVGSPQPPQSQKPLKSSSDTAIATP